MTSPEDLGWANPYPNIYAALVTSMILSYSCMAKAKAKTQ